MVTFLEIMALGVEKKKRIFVIVLLKDKKTI